MNAAPNKNSTAAPLPALMAAGTFVVDYHKILEHYPKERSGARVMGEQVSNGGAPLNLLVNLAKLQVDFPLYAAAKVGQDLDGRYIIDCCNEHGIDVSQITAVENASTGYTDVYTVENTGKHTCFHYCGIGDTFSRKDVKLRAVAPKILFLGSLGALGSMDQYSEEYGRSEAAQLIRDARKQNIITVIEISPIDRVSSLEQFKETLIQTDYLMINDRLAEALTGREMYVEGLFDAEICRQVCQELLATGLRKGVIIHAAAGAAALNIDGDFHFQPGALLSAELRRGTAGVDHAFAAGYLAGLYHEKPTDVCLTQGLAVAMACRRDISPSNAVNSLDSCLAAYNQCQNFTSAKA